MQEPEGQQHADVQQHHEYEGHSAQDVVVCEEDEGLHETKAGSQVDLQSEVLLPDGRPARRVLTHTKMRNTHITHTFNAILFINKYLFDKYRSDTLICTQTSILSCISKPQTADLTQLLLNPNSAQANKLNQDL